MTVVLVHHAEAVGPEVDAQRPLSARGHQQAEWLAEQLRAAGVSPAAIWHSGKLRARQTAEAFYRACGPFAEFKMVRGLRPDDPGRAVLDLLAGEHRDLLLVGHMPNIRDALRVLSSGSAEFPLHGLVVLEPHEPGGWTETWRAVAPAA
jgi:phosphohistidine phosphatase